MRSGATLTTRAGLDRLVLLGVGRGEPYAGEVRRQRRVMDMGSETASRHAVTEVPADRRPWAQLSTDKLLDRLEWSYGETGGFEPEVVWELARRASEATGAP